MDVVTLCGLRFASRSVVRERVLCCGVLGAVVYGDVCVWVLGCEGLK